MSIVTGKYLELVATSEKRDLNEQESLQYYHCLVLLEHENAVPDVDEEKVKKWRDQQDATTKATIDHYTDNVVQITKLWSGPDIVA